MVKKTDVNKVCKLCAKTKPENNFYKTNNSPLMNPDGRLDICNECVKDSIDYEDTNQVIDLLRQMNKPFLADQWGKAKSGTKMHPISQYISIVNSLAQYRDKTFADSDNSVMGEDVDSIKVYSESGKEVILTDAVKRKWGTVSGYSTEDFLKLERLYVDMKETYEIDTPSLEQMLLDICRLNLEKEVLMASKNYADYERISRVYTKSMTDAGFRPVDKKSGLDSIGMNSFGEVVALIERDGFIPPKMIDNPRDDIDDMLLYFTQWNQRFRGTSISTDVDPNWREHVDYDDEIDIEESNLEEKELVEEEILPSDEIEQ